MRLNAPTPTILHFSQRYRLQPNPREERTIVSGMLLTGGAGMSAMAATTPQSASVIMAPAVSLSVLGGLMAKDLILERKEKRPTPPEG